MFAAAVAAIVTVSATAAAGGGGGSGLVRPGAAPLRGDDDHARARVYRARRRGGPGSNQTSRCVSFARSV